MRINDHLLIQLVEPDQIVLLDEEAGTEIVIPLGVGGNVMGAISYFLDSLGKTPILLSFEGPAAMAAWLADQNEAASVETIASFAREYRANMDPEDGYDPKYVEGYDAATRELAAAILDKFLPEDLPAT